MQAAGGGGGGREKAMPLDMPQGKTKGFQSLWLRLRGYCGSCCAEHSSGEESGNFDKKASQYRSLTPNGLAFIFGGECNCDEVPEYTHKFEGVWLSASTDFMTIVWT